MGDRSSATVAGSGGAKGAPGRKRPSSAVPRKLGRKSRLIPCPFYQRFNTSISGPPRVKMSSRRNFSGRLPKLELQAKLHRKHYVLLCFAPYGGTAPQIDNAAFRHNKNRRRAMGQLQKRN
jgi:hypothetical protein